MKYLDCFDVAQMLRRAATTAAALAGLLLCGCREPTYSITTENLERFVVTTDGSGLVVQVKNRESGAVRPYNHVPMQKVFRSQNDYQNGEIPDLLARTVVSASTTLFGLAVNGSIVELDAVNADTVRTLATQFEWYAGAASLRNDRIYAVGPGPQNRAAYSPSLSIVNITTFQIEATIPFPDDVLPRAATMSPDGKYVYIAAPARALSASTPSTTSLLIFDTAARTIAKTLVFDSSITRPEVVASADGGLVFVTTQNGVVVVDALTQTLSHTIAESNFGSLHIALDPSGATLYVAPVFSQGDFGVAVYDIATSTRSGFIPVQDLSTMSLAVSNDGSYLAIDQIVPDAQGRNDFPVIKTIDLRTRQIVSTIPWTLGRDTPYTTGSLFFLPEP